MIEFKAECGHTVRARDDDGGGVVRCSYCGKTVAVPESREDALDFLFEELQQGAEPGAAVGGGRRGRASFLGRRPRAAGGINPFPIIVRLCYAALLIIIVVVVVRKFVMPLFDRDATRPRFTQGEEPPKKKPRPTRDSTAQDTAAPPGYGLLNQPRTPGLYVSSTPPGATAYCVAESEAPADGLISALPNCQRLTAPAAFSRLPNGTFAVELVLPWNDAVLTRYAEYTEFRRKLERASAKDRIKLLERYFIPDEAVAVFVHETPDQKYLVRQYRGIEVRDGQSRGVRGLFLPRITREDGNRFSIEDLVVNYIPDKVTYGFDENHVRGELEYYGVPSEDQPWVLKALARIGAVPYSTPDRRTLVFKIGIHTGQFAARQIRDAG